MFEPNDPACRVARNADALRAIGWQPALAAALEALVEDGDHQSLADSGQLLRVSAVFRDSLRLHDGEAELDARLHPRLARQLAEAGTEIATGDWVLASADEHDAAGPLWVELRVPPLTHLVRRDAEGRRHVLASNVDVALLVMGLDLDFNPRRLERYVALVLASGVEPVVVLTKADRVAPDEAARAALVGDEIEALQQRLGPHRGKPISIVAVNGTLPSAAATLAPWLGAGRTLVLLGSSGAGKSTLTNTLLRADGGAPVQRIQAVREHDHRGQHTTTTRTLHRLPGGGCVIDTPGLRALRPDLDEGALAASFADIEALAAQCRFRDCSHADEPGCAVRAAVHPDRLANWRKLLREARRDTMSALERQQLVSVWKARGRQAKVALRLKRGEGER
ncbi:ribosome small subunit-dependent GTPase A [Rivibacter subsaxonicus]|uniref:Small ribosomal subunit biogenesis GTPase RsgA n=1 Tax=Rivibacter subsaxonicus TaxID=457575 RepID=A0A4Q7W1M3_9BURK|nr:ribosome small subunit-dependent GTPase A [Rivibacter subsaxonicus]RZU02923.1 ribosome biogenesis GTPase [Rivibacter subsaxonicus]